MWDDGMNIKKEKRSYATKYLQPEKKNYKNEIPKRIANSITSTWFMRVFKKKFPLVISAAYKIDVKNVAIRNQEKKPPSKKLFHWRTTYSVNRPKPAVIAQLNGTDPKTE